MLFIRTELEMERDTRFLQRCCWLFQSSRRLCCAEW